MSITKQKCFGFQHFNYTPKNQNKTLKIQKKKEETNEISLVDVNNISCELIITIDLKKSGDTKKEFYHINYDWKYNGNTQQEIRLAKQLHPLYENEYFLKECNGGAILCKNYISDKVVIHLLNPINNIKNDVASCYCPYEHQIKLFKIVALLNETFKL